MSYLRKISGRTWVTVPEPLAPPARTDPLSLPSVPRPATTGPLLAGGYTALMSASSVPSPPRPAPGATDKRAVLYTLTWRTPQGDWQAGIFVDDANGLPRLVFGPFPIERVKL